MNYSAPSGGLAGTSVSCITPEFHSFRELVSALCSGVENKREFRLHSVLAHVGTGRRVCCAKPNNCRLARPETPAEAVGAPATTVAGQLGLLSQLPHCALLANCEVRNGPMPDVTLWGLFVMASVVLLLTPGPAVLFIVARSIEQGRLAGLISVLGIHLGTIVHIFAAAIGLSALLVSSAVAFAIVKYLGAAYLIWIGIRTFMAKDASAETPVTPAEPLGRVFRDGFLVNLFNPKTAIFFLAFLPQFVDPKRGPLHWQILILGMTFMGLGIISDGMFALAAGAAGDLLRRNQRFLRFQRRVASCSFIGLGVTAALASRK